MAPRLSEEFGQQFVIDNRAGAGGSIGVEIVVRANPDGNTILVGASSYASNVALYKLTYDPIKGIAPVTLITKGPFIVSVHPSVPAKDTKELIALARETAHSHVRLVRHRKRAASRDRAFLADDRGEHGARAVQRRRACDHRATCG